MMFPCNAGSLSNIAQYFYLWNVVPRVLDNITQDLFLCYVVWSLKDNTTRSFSRAMLSQEILLRQYYTDKTLCSVALDVPNNISQEKIPV